MTAVCRYETGVSSSSQDTLTPSVSRVYLLRGFPLTRTATSPARFSQIHSFRQLDAALNQIDAVKNMAMACINDDIPDIGGQGVRDRFTSWMKGRWGGSGVWDEWEKEEVAW